MQLTDVKIVFNEEEHTYTTEDGRQLDGITGMLERQLFPNTYANVPRSVLMKAAEYGTARHHEMEDWVNNGNEDADIVKCFKAELMNELSLCNAIPVCAEYTVTDFKNHASNIDLVMSLSDNEVILIDHKTYSDFSEEKKKKVAWQLSLYAYMFELCNPNINVVGQYAYWYKNGKHALYGFDRVDNALCIQLIDCEDRGVKFQHDLVLQDTQLPQEYSSKIAMFLAYKKRVDTLQEELREQLKEYMEANNATSIKNDLFTVSYIKESTQTRVDSAKLKANFPHVYDQVTKQVTAKATVKFTLK